MRSLALVPALVALAAPALAQDACPGRYPAEAASLTCACAPGVPSGSVWGSEPYTADSAICVAAVHAGVIDAESGGVVTAVLGPGEASYTGSTANGMTTRDWGSYGSSFSFERVSMPEGLAACESYPLSEAEYTCGCAADALEGSVWGSGPYTADSSICAAARHAGAIGAGGGAVTALAFPGLAEYLGSARNGVETMDWGADAISFVFDMNRSY